MAGEKYTSGTTPLSTNTLRVIEVKILNALNGGAGGGGSSGATTGNGPPVTPGTAEGQLYVDLQDLSVWVWDTKGGWLTTAVLIGTANPEGSQSGSPGKLYFNSTNSSLWMFNGTAGNPTGWIQLI